MPERPAARRRGAARNQRRGTLLDSLPRAPVPPVPPRAPNPGGRSGSYPAAPASRRPVKDDADTVETVETPGRLTLPSMPRMAARRRRADSPAPRRPRAPRDSWDSWDDTASVADAYPSEYSDYAGSYDERGADDYDGAYGDADRDGWEYQTRTRDRSLARPLTPALPQYNDTDDALPAVFPPVFPPLPTDSAPELAAFRPMRAPRRMRLDTRALARSARSPWTLTRLALALMALTLALMHAPGQMGEPSQPLMIARAEAGLAPGGAITRLVKPETQLLRPDLYDNYAQFQEWGGAACSAAALSEVLTAYGVPHATIGHEIDELGAYISPNGGLLNRRGFAVVAAKHNLRADQSMSLTYNQLLYLTEQLGMPVIVNVHISYGYYHFFDGGHFLTVVGGDAQGLQIVDSSEYYIHYLPKDVFYQMFTGYTAAIVPGNYQYTLPNN
jgi:hypothetical protein